MSWSLNSTAFTLLTLIIAAVIAAASGEQQQMPTASSTAAADVETQQHSADPDLTVELHRSLRFEPPQLDFGAWAVGTAHAHTVTLVNQNANRSVYLSSVSGRTAAFYSSFFEAKVVPPQGNTTFSVVFLPRKHGTIASDLLIHTSFGQARLEVRGEGRDCPYRLKSIVGVRAPLNATLTPEIHMYNPHRRPLQILEVYSSGGQFQLELPSGGQEGPQALWEIPPHTEKPVIRIRFQGRSAGNHTAYIRIKISEQPEDALAASENVLVIPVEFEILSQHGLFAENPVLDFGRVTTMTSAQHKPPPPLRLQLRQSHERRHHEITGYEVGGGDNTGFSFDVASASLTLDPALFDTTTSVDTTLRLRTASKRNASQTLELTLLVRAEIFKGTLAYDRNSTIFVTTQQSAESSAAGAHFKRRTLIVRNDFEQPLALLNVTGDVLNESSPFSRALQLQMGDEYAAGIVLAPGISLPLLQLQLLTSTDASNFRTNIRIYTNVTHFELPLIVCPGQLHISTRADPHVSLLRSPDEVYNLELNLGAIPLAEMSQNGFIVLRNPNPLAIKLTTWDFQSPRGVYFHTIFLGCLRAHGAQSPPNATEAAVAKNDTGGVRFEFCSHLEEGDVAVFQVAIQSYITEDHAVGTLKLWTAYETITTTVKFRTWMGKLEVDQEQLYFKNCFPGKLCSSDLSIRSTFKHPIHIDSINFTDAGLRFEDFQTKSGSTIAPDGVTKVGRIYFEPAKLCQNRCYIPQDEKNAAIAFPVGHDTKGGPNNNLHFDETELRRRTELFRHLKWYFQTIAFTLNSREVRQFQLQLIIDIEWPKLVEGGRQTLPTIEVGKVQQMPIVLSNPADSAILVDYFLADPLFAKETQLSLPFEVVDISSNCYLTDKPVFSLADAASSRRQPLLVPAHSSIAVAVRFLAHEADTHCTLLHIRNNLTLYEAVWLSGKTVQSQFRFGNRKPGSSTPLLFEVSEKQHLAACAMAASDDLIGSSSKQSTVITKRTFTARNTGEIPIWIETFLIGDQPCEGYGFRVLDCTSFELKANASKKIEIAFRPDFTAVRVARPLTLRTNLSYDVEYVLLAQLPPISSLDQCAERLPRPPWEQRIRNASIVLLAITFVLVLVAAHIDYGNILMSQSALYATRDKAPMHPTFNLRNIATNKAPTVPTAEDAVAVAQAAKNKSNQQQQKASGASHNLKKRATGAGVKKSGVNGSGVPASGIGRNMSLSDLPWSLDLTSGSGQKITTPTFSERNFKLRLEAERAAAAAAHSSSNSSCSSMSNESSAKSTLPPSLPKATASQSTTPSCVATSEKEATGVKKQPQQRGAKKTKNVGNEKAFEEQQRGATQKTAGGNKYGKTSADKIAQTAAATEALSAKGDASDSCIQQQSSRPFASKDGGATRGKHAGKTPGRERRKDTVAPQNNVSAGGGGDAGAHFASASTSSTSSASSSTSSGEAKRGGGAARKQRNRANALLNFNNAAATTVAPSATFESPSSVLSCLTTTPWESSNPISFSDVLQNSPIGTAECDYGTAAYLPERPRSQLTDAEHALLDNDLNRNLSTQVAPATTPERAELGPIGSKKSPSSTPAVWEPIAAAASAHQLPKPTSISNNSSFFSNLLPTTSSASFAAYDGQVQPNQYMGVPAGLYELKKAQEELQRQWQNNEYILSMRQQQLQHHTHAQQQSGVGFDALGNWTGLNSSTTWTPMGYGHGGVNVVNATATAAALGTGASPAVATSALGPWQNVGSVGAGGIAVRPPPGLEANYQNIIQQAHQQQQQHQSAVAADNATDAAPLANDAEMQTFDPFSSLSSIWSDNWNKQPNQRNNIN